MTKDNLNENHESISELNNGINQEKQNHAIKRNEIDTLNIRRVPSNEIPNQSPDKQKISSSETYRSEQTEISNTAADNNSEHTIQVPLGKINAQFKKTDSAEEQSLHGSNSNVQNNQTIVRKNSMAYDTETLKQYLNKNMAKKKKDMKEQSLQQMQEDIKHGAKLYELIGYTTVGKVNYSFEKENKQRFMRNTLITILLVIIIILAILIMNPIKDGVDFNKILGIDSKYRYDEMEQTGSVKYPEMTSLDEFNEDSP